MLQVNGLDSRLREHAEQTFAYAFALGLHPVVTSVRRSEQEQRRLYQAYVSGKAKYPAAPPGNSAHQWGVAFDSVVPAEELAAWTAVRRAFGWLAPDSDTVHAEWPGWQSYISVLRYS